MKSIRNFARYAILFFVMLVSRNGIASMTDIYIDNRLSEKGSFDSIFVQRPSYGNTVVGAQQKYDQHAKIASIPLIPRALGPGVYPADYSFSITLNGQIVTIDCCASNLNNNPGASVRLGTTYTERSAQVAGVSNAEAYIVAGEKRYRITLQVYPYPLGVKADINIVVQLV